MPSKTFTAVTVNNAHQSQSIRLETESSTAGKTHAVIYDDTQQKQIGTLTVPDDTPYGIELFGGKGGFMAMITAPTGMQYFALPGATVGVSGIELVLTGSPITSNAAKQKTQRKAPTVQQHTLQATILGAGLATRFERVSGESTQFSKPAVPLVGTQSVIQLMADKLADSGFETLIVNTYFKPDSLKASLQQSKINTIQYIDETAPSGTAGGLRKMLCDPAYAGILDRSKPLLVAQGDSVSDVDFGALMNHHKAQNAIVTLGCQLVEDKDVDKFGIIVTDRSGEDGQSGKITGFQEKPALSEAKSNLGNTGFYIFSPAAYPIIEATYNRLLTNAQQAAKDAGEPVPEAVLMDFATDVFPAVLAAVQENPSLGAFWAQSVSGYWSDIGNPTQYIETVHDIYAEKVNLTLPDNQAAFYENGIVYWQGAKQQVEAAGAQLSGNIIVAIPFSPDASC